jgi:hypothetical protein
MVFLRGINLKSRGVKIKKGQGNEGEMDKGTGAQREEEKKKSRRL